MVDRAAEDRRKPDRTESRRRTPGGEPEAPAANKPTGADEGDKAKEHQADGRAADNEEGKFTREDIAGLLRRPLKYRGECMSQRAK